MKYKVLVSFTDGEDKDAPPGQNIYMFGMQYPRDDYEPSEDRVTYLQSDQTALGKPVIAKRGKK